jgi:hypothetical protein
VIRIAISQAAFEAIARTLPLGSVSFENKITEKGERLIWLEPNVVDRLRVLRGPGESYSDVILRIAGREGQIRWLTGTMRARRSTPFSGSSKRARTRLARTMAGRQTT